MQEFSRQRVEMSALREGRIEYTKGKAIAHIHDEVQWKELLNQATSENLPLSEIETRIKELQAEMKLEPTLKKAS